MPPSLDYGFKQLKDTNPYDPNKAKTLLAKSGWTDTNGDGIVDYTMIDELIALAGSTLDATIARNAIINAQQILLDENATIFLGYPKINMIGKSYLKGIHTSPSEYYVITKDLKKE